MSFTEKFCLHRSILLFTFLCISLSVFSQESKEKLQKDKKKIEEEISFTNNLLKETKKSKAASLNQLLILNKKITQREELIATITTEVQVLDRKITQNNQNVRDLRNELKSLKDEYARMIYFAFKNRNIYDRLVFVFSADDFNQAYRRLKYFQQYSSYRKTQAKMIESTGLELKAKSEELEGQKSEKLVLIQEKEREMGQLVEEKKEKDITVNALNKKEKNLRASLRAKEKEAKKLQNAIEAIISAEIRAAAERARAEKKESGISLTPEEMQLSNTFIANKGKLPWPSERGIISGTFGEHQHPVLKRVKIKNNGINILTNKGEVARAVFEGTVISVKAITNTNIAVIVRHGEYFSVYSNLINVFVQRGDHINTKQEIGTIYTNPEDNKTELHFEIWKGKTLLNPKYWILSKK